VKPLVTGAAVGVVGALVLAIPASDAVRDMVAARADRARTAEIAAGPTPSRAIVADGQALAAPDAAAAADALARLVRERAGRAGLLVEQAAGVPSPGLARVRIAVSGGEDAVVGFADALERGRPLVRFDRWSMAARGGGVTLQGEVVAPWQ
jgi:hypothetical protein